MQEQACATVSSLLATVAKKRKLDPTSPTKRTAKVTIETFESYRGIVVLFPADELFVPGTAQLRAEAKSLLFVVADRAKAAEDYNLSIEVRRPEAAPRSPKFRDVWSITAAQAVTLNRFMRIDGGIEAGRVIAVGRGPAPPTQKPGSTQTVKGSTVEFTFLSRVLKPKD